MPQNARVIAFTVSKLFRECQLGGVKFHLPPRLGLIYSSVIETKEVQMLIIKVGSVSVCLLFCQLYYTGETYKSYV